MSAPLISVVIPARNAADWIGETLRSVRDQTFPAAQREVIVVDDESSDDTTGVCARILGASGLRYQILHTGVHSGPSAARNLGWRQASGSWIQFLDADDLIEPEKIEIQARAAASAGDGVASLYSPWAHLVCRDEEWSCGAIFDPAIGVDPIREVLHPSNFVHTGCQLFQRTWLADVGGFNESYRLIEDVDLQLRLLMRGATMVRVATTRPLFWYRQRPGSLSRESTTDFMHACVRNIRAVERHWRVTGALTVDRVRALADLYFGPVRFFAEHDPVAFEEVFATIEALAPASLPSGPRTLRWLSRLVGYRKAERCAVAYRRLKRRYRGRASESAMAQPAA